MRINLRADGLTLDTSTKDAVEARIPEILSRFAPEIQDVEVIVSDHNGPKGGVDKHSVVKVNPKSLPSITVQTTQVNVEGAVIRGVRRARRILKNRLNKRRDVRRRS